MVTVTGLETAFVTAEEVDHGIDEIPHHGRLPASRSGHRHTKTPAASKRMSQGLTGREASRSHDRRVRREMTAMRSVP